MNQKTDRCQWKKDPQRGDTLLILEFPTTLQDLWAADKEAFVAATRKLSCRSSRGSQRVAAREDKEGADGGDEQLLGCEKEGANVVGIFAKGKTACEQQVIIFPVWPVHWHQEGKKYFSFRSDPRSISQVKSATASLASTASNFALRSKVTVYSVCSNLVSYSLSMEIIQTTWTVK